VVTHGPERLPPIIDLVNLIEPGDSKASHVSLLRPNLTELRAYPAEPRFAHDPRAIAVYQGADCALLLLEAN
jgi:hypothetical protein